MGEMADLDEDRLASGETIVEEIATGRRFTVPNSSIMYSSAYDDKLRYRIIGDEGDEEN